MSDYVEGLDDEKPEDNVVEMEEINDDFDNLWTEEKDDVDDTDDASSGSEAGDDDGDSEGTESTDDSSGDEGADDSDDGDSDDDDNDNGGQDEDSGIELELVAKPNEDLVSAVETIFMADQFHLSEDQIKEIFDGTDESYEQLMEANLKAGNNMAIEQIYNSLPERGKDFFDYLIKTNMQGDIDGWLDLERQVKSLSDYDPANLTEEEAKAILEDEYKTKGLQAKQVKFIVEALEDNDEHVSEAKKVLKAKLELAESAKQAKLDADLKAAKEIKDKEIARHSEVVKYINGTKFAKQKQEELYNLIYNVPQGSSQPVIVTRIANIIQNNPEHLVQLAQLFDGYTEENGFDMKRLKKQVKTDTTKKTKRTIKRKSKASLKGSQTRHSKGGTGQSLDDWLGDDDL